MTELARDAFVDGRWVTGTERFAVRDPFDGSTVADVTDSDASLVDAAIDAAARAFPAWRTRTGPERGKLLAELGRRMLADERRLAELCTRENGKALSESIAEVRYAASFFSWFAGEAERAYGETIPASHPAQRLIVTREPVGPCALITPWNFPYAMLTRKIGAALAAGCTTVTKPAHQTPLSALAIAQLGEQVGIPAGVINVVPCMDAARAGTQLVGSPAIRKISFTGSTRVGILLLEQAAKDVKRVTMELGGNAPFVVLADADVDAAVAAAMVAKFRNAGQSCVAANRFLLEAPIAEEFTRKLLAKVATLKVGRGLDPGVEVGPLVDAPAAKKVRRLVDDAVAKGARVLHGALPDEHTNLFPPMVLSGITDAMALWREEIFGPVVGLRTVADETEALTLANATDAGLVSYVFTRDGARQMRFADGLQSGMVGVNEGLVSTAQAPFGGIKHSGLGREGSRHALDDYSNLKYVALRI